MSSRITFIKRPEDYVFERVEVDLTMKVEWKNGKPITFLLPSLEDTPATTVETKKSFTLDDVRSYAEETAFHLWEASALAETSSSLENILMRVQGIGKQLARNLVPFQVRQFITELPESAVLHIETAERWIPWEFVYDENSQAFWGERYIIGRQLVLDLDSEDFQLARSRRRQEYDPCVSEMVNVVGDISEPKAAQGLFNAFVENSYPTVHINEVDQKRFLSVAELKAKAKGADVVNFTCHNCHSKGGNYLRLGPDPINHHLYVFMVNQLLLRRCLVFVNACSSGAPSIILNDILNFGCEFCLAGAETFIGTIAPVPTEPALVFARRFYRHFFNGKSAGEALYLAKQESRAERDPFWLCYCLYGETSARKQIKYPEQ